jgi:hypothetical protein
MSEQLSIFTWNVRGLNAPVRREAVRDMVQAVRPKLACLQETKLAVISPQIATEILGQRFDGFEYLPANGTRGGIILGWHSDFIVASDLLLKRFSLSMVLRPAWEVSPFLLTVVYGPTDDADKVEFLNELLSPAPTSQMQWIST